MSVSERVRDVIAEALFIDRETVTPQSNLIRDLGAESIDFLDVVFRLEKEFGIRIPRGDIEKRTQGELNDAEFAVEGQLTDLALERLREQMPEVSSDAITSGLKVREIPHLMTVASFERMVMEQLEGGAKAAPGAARATSAGEGSHEISIG